uniref:uncharacterized protein LOC113475183 n=1 Tax=Ciona intestinalis TaxID=7719 RepID=UPI000EF46FF8|nr:uncharacterized protein LOC113475183 [Ciona intestinalis]|eukprot:XP_026694816.1 uncharacterized protein LOC113475183 [Ciona intestinalis]
MRFYSRTMGYTPVKRMINRQKRFKKLLLASFVVYFVFYLYQRWQHEVKRRKLLTDYFAPKDERSYIEDPVRCKVTNLGCLKSRKPYPIHTKYKFILDQLTSDLCIKKCSKR